MKTLSLLKYLIIFSFITGCGFKIVNQSELLNFNIIDISISGDNRISYIIKNKLLPYSKDNGKKLIKLEIEIKKDKNIKEKNIKNEITKFEIYINAIVNYNRETGEKFVINKRGDYIVTSQYSQTLNNEKKLIKNLSESLAENIIDELTERVNDL